MIRINFEANWGRSFPSSRSKSQSVLKPLAPPPNASCANLGEKVLLVCASEDADFLARGIFEAIDKPSRSRKRPAAFACFWQARFDPVAEGPSKRRFEVAPIIKRYEEPTGTEIDSLIIVKSIIATSCIVRHALLDTIERKHPKKIFVVSPVISRGAPESLRSEFPKSVSKLFEFVYFAEDDAPGKDGIVRPGVGGTVHDRLPLLKTEGITVPKIVIERRNRQERLNYATRTLTSTRRLAVTAQQQEL